MKKIIFLLIYVLLPSAIYAWIVETGTETKTVKFKITDFTNEDDDNTRSYVWQLCEYGYDSYHFINVRGITSKVTKINDARMSSTATYTGFNIGKGFRESVSTLVIDHNLNNKIIKKLIINYVATENYKDCHPAIKGHLGLTTYTYSTSEGDIKGIATIEPYLPSLTIPIVCEQNNLYSDEDMAKGYCLITDITVEFVDIMAIEEEDGCKAPINNYTTDYLISLGKEVSKLKSLNHSFWRNTLLGRKKLVWGKHYAKAVASDVNSDNNVNSADVASVYKAINSGDDEVYGIRCVDLGLPSGILWATMNYGALVPEDFGDFYAHHSTAGFLSHNIAAFNEDAYRKWEAPAPWRTPTRSEAMELLNHTTTTKTRINDVYCVVLTSKINGNQLILPAVAGEVNENGYNDKAYSAQYWTSTVRPSDATRNFTINIPPYNSDFDLDTDNSMYYYEGCYLRLVCPKQN